MNGIFAFCSTAAQRGWAWIWTRQQQLTFIATIALLMTGVVTILGVFYTAQSVRLQYRQYQDETFNREAGAVSLAWRAIADANSRSSETGQSSAFQFLSSKGLMNGNITLNGSYLSLHQRHSTEPLELSLSRSSLCGSEVFLTAGSNSYINFSNSFLIGARLVGRMIKANFTGANLEQAEFDNIRVLGAKFIASQLNGATLRGGSFERADFQGANLTGLQTYRGYRGAGTKYEDDRFGGGLADGYYAEPIDSMPPVYFAAPSDDVSTLVGRYDLPEQNVHLVDFRGARFLQSVIKGADLSNSTITQNQVDEACADQSTRVPSGVVVKKICTEDEWIGERRKRIQEKTFYGRSKDLETCKMVAAEPGWK